MNNKKIEPLEEFNILKIFFEDPNTEFNTREIARIVKISPATASKKLKTFAKKEIIKERKERIHSFNRFSYFFF